jgi:hypothetical protein
VAERVKGDRHRPAAFTVHAQSDLLGHCAARKKECGRLTQERGDTFFERCHHATDAVVVNGGIGGNGRE